jgi:hypothetical protein
MGSQAWMDGRLRTIAHRAIAEPGLKLPLTGKTLPDQRHALPQAARLRAPEVLQDCTRSCQRIGMHFRAGASRLSRYDDPA